jgi:hypothetical protein
MTRSRIMSALALIALAGFLGILVVKLKRVDLAAMALVGIGLAGYDLWSQLWRGRPR